MLNEVIYNGIKIGACATITYTYKDEFPNIIPKSIKGIISLLLLNKKYTHSIFNRDFISVKSQTTPFQIHSTDHPAVRFENVWISNFDDFFTCTISGDTEAIVLRNVAFCAEKMYKVNL